MDTLEDVRGSVATLQADVCGLINDMSNVITNTTGPMGPTGMPGDPGIDWNYCPTVWHDALHKQIQDAVCSKDELLCATFLGEWTVKEHDGLVTTTSEYEGKFYLLNVRAAQPNEEEA